MFCRSIRTLFELTVNFKFHSLFAMPLPRSPHEAPFDPERQAQSIQAALDVGGPSVVPFVHADPDSGQRGMPQVEVNEPASVSEEEPPAPTVASSPKAAAKKLHPVSTIEDTGTSQRKASPSSSRLVYDTPVSFDFGVVVVTLPVADVAVSEEVIAFKLDRSLFGLQLKKGIRFYLTIEEESYYVLYMGGIVTYPSSPEEVHVNFLRANEAGEFHDGKER